MSPGAPLHPPSPPGPAARGRGSGMVPARRQDGRAPAPQCSRSAPSARRAEREACGSVTTEPAGTLLATAAPGHGIPARGNRARRPRRLRAGTLRPCGLGRRTPTYPADTPPNPARGERSPAPRRGQDGASSARHAGAAARGSGGCRHVLCPAGTCTGTKRFVPGRLALAQHWTGLLRGGRCGWTRALLRRPVPNCARPMLRALLTVSL